MATHEIPIIGWTAKPDSGISLDLVSNQLTLASAPGNKFCYVMPDPGGGGDHGISGDFRVPPNYVGSPVLVIRGILDGAPTTEVIAFGFQISAVADDEAYDAALGTEQTASASSVSQADEDVYEERITLTAGDYAVADDVDYFFFVDDSAHTYSGNFLLTGLYFEYSDA